MSTSSFQDAFVYLIDNDAETRRSVAFLMFPAGLRYQAYESPQAFLDDYEDRGPGCIVTEVRLPELSGLELQDVAKARGITHPFIFHSAFADVPCTISAFRKGAFDFLQKQSSESMMIDCVQRAIDFDRQQRVLEQNRRRVSAAFDQLSPRERLVLSMLTNGVSNKQIAWELGLTKQTVSAHRAHLLNKFGASNLTELVILIADCDLLEGIQSEFAQNPEQP